MRTSRSWRWRNFSSCRRPELKSLEIVCRKWLDDAKKKARRRTRMRSIADCDTGKHVCPRGCDAGDTTNQSVQNHCESSCNENKCEGTARLFDCKTRHRSDVLPCEGERARRNHSSEGLAPPGIGWTCVKALYGTREASKCCLLLRQGCSSRRTMGT